MMPLLAPGYSGRPVDREHLHAALLLPEVLQAGLAFTDGFFEVGSVLEFRGRIIIRHPPSECHDHKHRSAIRSFGGSRTSAKAHWRIAVSIRDVRLNPGRLTSLLWVTVSLLCQKAHRSPRSRMTREQSRAVRRRREALARLTNFPLSAAPFFLTFCLLGIQFGLWHRQKIGGEVLLLSTVVTACAGEQRGRFFSEARVRTFGVRAAPLCRN